MIRVAALTGGIHVPSTRFRIGQYVSGLRLTGVDVEEFHAPWGSYPPEGLLPRLVWLPRTLAERTAAVLKSRRYDVAVFQRELISTLPTVEALSRSPRVLDVDDAIWLHRGGWAANHMARLADHIVCGNSFLAEYFSRFGKPISILPTAVDCRRYTPLTGRKANGLCLGWSGTSSGFANLREIEGILAKALREHRDWNLRIISDRPPELRVIPHDRIEYIKWTPEDEVHLIQEIDVGLMPLTNSDWARGKCSYKMLLYMACGIPVVATDVGMNREVLALGEGGFGVNEPNDWFAALNTLMDDDRLRKKMGEIARDVVIEHFDTPFAISQWSKILHDLVQP